MYHDENDTIDVLATNSAKMYVLCAVIENSLHTNMIGRSKLVWFKDTLCEAFHQRLFTGFLSQYAESYHQIGDYRKTTYSAF